MTDGYYRWPTVYKDQLSFVCEDDLWTVPLNGGIPRRLTADLGQCTQPLYSPDGSQLAFINTDEGHQEVYIMPAEGGEAKRLTYFGTSVTRMANWKPDGSAIICSTSAQQTIRRKVGLFAVSPQGGIPHSLELGMAHNISYGENGALLVGRHTWDPARWKRYKGGTKGVIWIDNNGDGQFELLLDIEGNIGTPMWIGDLVYFVSDHEGVGNLYSCTPEGKDIKRLSDHLEYFVRFPSTDGTTIVYQAGAELFAYNIASGSSNKIDIHWRSSRVQRKRKFVSASAYLENYDIHPKGHSLSVLTRGKPFSMGLWEGPALQIGQLDGVRYRSCQYLNDGERVAVISDEPGYERVELYRTDGTEEPEYLDDLDLGRPDEMSVSHVEDKVAIANHRHELIVVDLETKTSKVLDKSENLGGIKGVRWSPDGLWLAYSYGATPETSNIRLCEVSSGQIIDVTEPMFTDMSPSFDPDGKYLYFLSARDFNPVYDELHFSLGFPKGIRPYLVTLQQDTPSPLVSEPRAPGAPLEGEKDEDDTNKDGTKVENKDDEEKEEDKKPEPIVIDAEGIQQRVIALPVPEDRYRHVIGLKNKVMYSVFPIEGRLGQDWHIDNLPKAKGTLKVYDYALQEEETLISGMSSIRVSEDKKVMLVQINRRLRILPAGEKPSDKPGANSDRPCRKSGWLDLNRIKVQVTPGLEWKQMYGDAWRRMRDHFWTEDMSKVDWKKVYDRYLPLVDKVAARSEHADLIWEMQGELGTSHAYEMGGDYRSSPKYNQGHLGADFEWDSSQNGYRITHIVKGDTWNAVAGGPLAKPGINVSVGDVITAINARDLSETVPPQSLLVNQANKEVLLAIKKNGEKDIQSIRVKTIALDMEARYRDWIESNRQYVHEKSGGKIGYVHIPDMGVKGFSEFHRYYLVEYLHDALLVDVRFNGGGHVSQLLLDKLNRKRLGYDLPRWGKAEPYPSYSVLGPMLALTDENAGSDGDIFSHSFKMMKLGTLMGTRTWGGVIGIDGRGRLVDNSVTTQPEYSFWFHDVGWGVENYGTDPDIEVQFPPHSYKAKQDIQLDRAIEELLRQLDEIKPEIPDLSKRPDLKLPTELPPR